MVNTLLKSKYLKPIFIALSTVYFISVYSVCNYYYPDSDPMSVGGWWNMKCDSYLSLVVVWIGIANMPKCTDKGLIRINRVITAIGIGFGMANFIDRRFLHDREFGLNDLGIIILIALVSQIDLKKIKHKAIKQFKNN